MHVRNHHSPSICFLVLVIAIAASCETAIAQGANSESSAKTSGEWPTGAGGDVMVALGQVVTIPAGSVLDLTSLTVQFGGTLQIERGSGWTIIGCTGDITLQGTIVGVTCDKPYGLITASAPDNNVLRYYYAITSGGNGGGAGASIRSKGGAGSIYGNGGGGGATDTSNGGDASETTGGNGATDSGHQGDQCGPGGQGAQGLGNSGANGGTATGAPEHFVDRGGGRGGGTHGFNGQALYIKTLGSFRSLGGKIDLSGGPGGNGGNGGNAPDTTPSGRSDGGGGGSGGAGGRLILLYSGEYLPPEIHVEGGAPGKGGAGGAGSTQLGGAPPANGGVPGENGTAGGQGPAGRITILHGTTLPNLSPPSNLHLTNSVSP